MKGGILMTYQKTGFTYRIAFDTKENLFIAYNANNENQFAYGVTIEEAVAALIRN